MKRVELTGKKIGMLTVIGFDSIRNGASFWKCKCDCGGETVVVCDVLKRGKTKSCGCLKNGSYSITHGMRHSRIYNIRCNIKARCNNNKNHTYKNYGGRGITYDSKRESFEGFRNDMYESYIKHIEEYGEKETTIDRIDVNGNYCKENCRWATWKEQSNNTRLNHIVEYNGIKKTIQQWADYWGLDPQKIYRKRYKGWPIDLIKFFYS